MVAKLTNCWAIGNKGGGFYFGPGTNVEMSGGGAIGNEGYGIDNHAHSNAFVDGVILLANTGHGVRLGDVSAQDVEELSNLLQQSNAKLDNVEQLLRQNSTGQRLVEQFGVAAIVEIAKRYLGL